MSDSIVKQLILGEPRFRPKVRAWVTKRYPVLWQARAEWQGVLHDAFRNSEYGAKQAAVDGLRWKLYGSD